MLSGVEVPTTCDARETKRVAMTTSKLLYIYLKFMGLCPFILTEDGSIQFSYSGAFYTTILSLCYAVCFFKYMNNRLSFVRPNDTHMSIIADIAAKTTQFWMVITTWTCIGYRQNVLRSIYESFRNIVKTCRIIGVNGIHSINITSVMFQTLIFNCAWLSVFGISTLHTWNLPVQQIFRNPFNLGRLVHPNFVVLFIATMREIRKQFRLLNNKIRDISRDETTNTIEKLRYQKRTKATGIENLSESDRLNAYIRIHSDLVDLTDAVLTFCRAPLYLTMTIHLFELTSTAYIICLNLEDQVAWPLRHPGHFFELTVWFVSHFMSMITILSASDATTSEANRTGNILHKILIANPSNNLVESADILSLQLLQRPLVIELFGSLQIKFSIVYNVSSIMTTYVIMMTQLDDQKRERHKLRTQQTELKID